MSSTNELDARLLTCAGLVRKNSVVADIGSDHAYLPIYLVKNNICEKAIASDINEGPVKRAKMNIAISGLSQKITALRADGLDEAASFLPDDIVIAGMGGELICRILDRSQYIKNNNVRLILQPMTMCEVVRNYLAEKGFKIIDERLCTAENKSYQVICAEYDGTPRKFTSEVLTLGEVNIERIKSGNGTADDFLCIAHILDGANRRIEGKRKSKNSPSLSVEDDLSLQKQCIELLKYKEAE